jgi:hypothetical protein
LNKGPYREWLRDRPDDATTTTPIADGAGAKSGQWYHCKIRVRRRPKRRNEPLSLREEAFGFLNGFSAFALKYSFGKQRKIKELLT